MINLIHFFTLFLAENFSPFSRFSLTKNSQIPIWIKIGKVGFHVVEVDEFAELLHFFVADLNLEEVGQLSHALAEVCLHVFVDENVEIFALS